MFIVLGATVAVVMQQSCCAVQSKPVAHKPFMHPPTGATPLGQVAQVKKTTVRKLKKLK